MEISGKNNLTWVPQLDSSFCKFSKLSLKTHEWLNKLAISSIGKDCESGDPDLIPKPCRFLSLWLILRSFHCTSTLACTDISSSSLRLGCWHQHSIGHMAPQERWFSLIYSQVLQTSNQQQGSKPVLCESEGILYW
jgi:hypothetical protein